MYLFIVSNGISVSHGQGVGRGCSSATIQSGCTDRIAHATTVVITLQCVAARTNTHTHTRTVICYCTKSYAISSKITIAHGD